MDKSAKKKPKKFKISYAMVVNGLCGSAILSVIIAMLYGFSSLSYAQTMSLEQPALHAVGEQAEFVALAKAHLDHRKSQGDILNIRPEAPSQYVVKKGDTLWDIAEFYLYDPWLWPKLWMSNRHIFNPHLIYPGDRLSLVWIAGQPQLIIQRQTKPQRILSPQGQLIPKTAQPIRVFDWSKITPQLNQDILLTEPLSGIATVLGNADGRLRFGDKTHILTTHIPVKPAKGQFRIVRKTHTIKDMNGVVLSDVVRHLADAELAGVQPTQASLLLIKEQNIEIKQHDQVVPLQQILPENMALAAAVSEQAVLVGGIEERMIFGKYDVVVLHHPNEDIRPGLVFGIYQAGPDITVSEDVTQYADKSAGIMGQWGVQDTYTQPALKQGEAVVLASFGAVSYALITDMATMARRGAIFAQP